MSHAADMWAASAHEARRDGAVPDTGGWFSAWDDGRYEAPRALTALERAMPDLREQAVERLNTFNWDHARTAWERRRRDPLGPHVLLFLYADPDPHAANGHVWFTLRAAARLFLASDEPDLAKLLAEFQRATAPLLNARADPRGREMSNWTDPMSSGAVYLGVAISSLDTDDASWQQTQREALNDMGVPGQCYATLTDGTKLVIHRRAINDFGDVTVTTNRPHTQVLPARRWQWRYLPGHADPHTIDRARFNLWDQLDALHHRIQGIPHA
jgi:hypothetical protein